MLLGLTRKIGVAITMVESPAKLPSSSTRCPRASSARFRASRAVSQPRTHLAGADTALVDLLDALKAAKQGNGAPALKEAQALQRKAQWRVDFINAENSMGFPAPQESARVLGMKSQ